MPFGPTNLMTLHTMRGRNARGLWPKLIAFRDMPGYPHQLDSEILYIMREMTPTFFLSSSLVQKKRAVDMSSYRPKIQGLRSTSRE